LVKEFNENMLEHARPSLYSQTEKKSKWLPPNIFFIKYRCAKHILTNFCIQCFMVKNGLQMAKSTPMKNIRDVTRKKTGSDCTFWPYFKMSAIEI